MPENKLDWADIQLMMLSTPETLPYPEDVDRFYMWRLEDKPKNIYIAASINAVADARRLREELIAADFNVTSSWISLSHDTLKETTAKSRENHIRIATTMGERDIRDLSVADTLIALTDTPSTSGGLHVELGFFLGAKRTNIIVAGPRPNVFFWNRNIRWTPAVDGLVHWLKHPEHGT